MSKTIKQIADEIGVFKQRVYRHIKNRIGDAVNAVVINKLKTELEIKNEQIRDLSMRP